MLALLIALVVHQVPDPVQIEVGESKVVKVGKVQRLMVSGVTIYDVHSAGTDALEVIGHAPGRSTLIGWRTDGTQFSVPVSVIPASVKPKAVKVTKRAAPPGVSVFEFPASFSEITEVRELDGGVQLIGKSSDGTRLEVVVTPSAR